MKVITILLIFMPFLSVAQSTETSDNIKLVRISEDVAAQNLFASVVGAYEFSRFYAEDIHTKAIKKLYLSKDEFCLNSTCQNITSPVYFVRSSDSLEYNFSFRLNDGSLCIIVVIDNKIDIIELLPVLSRTHYVYANRNMN
jgi:hypothetical protein